MVTLLASLAIVAASAFMDSPAPLEMPLAEGYVVKSGGRERFEDRYDRRDLWTSQTVIGRWCDDDGRVFMLSELKWCPPANDFGVTLTRTDYNAQRVKMKRVKANGGFPDEFVDAVEQLAPCAVAERPRDPRQLPRGYRNVCYWQEPTNYVDIVCAFRPEKCERWYLASWSLVDGDDYPTQIERFEDEFLRREFPVFVKRLGLKDAEVKNGDRRDRAPTDERELLREDARHDVAAYPEWHSADSSEYTVLDDMHSRTIVADLTNDLAAVRTRFAKSLPTKLDLSRVLSVARIYNSREEYLEALTLDGMTNMLWSAACWCPRRRELIAYLPDGGEAELKRTFRHESFHQYLSYAAGMASASPWLNEGYAQYFEDDSGGDEWGEIEVTEESLKQMSLAVPGVLMLDYDQFYSGTSVERRLKYTLAWSIVKFIEEGADKVRLKPFAGLRERYMETLVETSDMRKATLSAFKDADTLKLFVAEWRKFWIKRGAD